MSWDIYGNPLQRGYCEVHPHVAEDYPCSQCAMESQHRSVAQNAQNKAWALQDENERLKAKVAELEQELNNMSHLLDNYDFVNALNGKELAIRDLEQQAKGLESYAHEELSGLDADNIHWMLIRAKNLREKAKKLGGNS